jgi:hypothetical protein
MDGQLLTLCDRPLAVEDNSVLQRKSTSRIVPAPASFHLA